MSLSSRGNETDTAATSNFETDPKHNNESGRNFQAGGGAQHVPDVGGANTGVTDPMHNDGGVTADPTHDNNRGGALKRGAEGAALGGAAGHAEHHGHTGRDAAVLGAGGAACQHEHNEHLNQGQNMAGAGPNTGDSLDSRWNALKRGVEGAVLGGAAGQGHQGHTGRDAGAGGAACQHEHNEHPNQGQNMAGAGPNTGGSLDSRWNALKRGVEGAVLGGAAGHAGHQGHTGRDAAVLGAGGAACQHEHNEHLDQGQNGAGPNTRYANDHNVTNGGGPGVSSNAAAGGVTSNQGNMPNLAEAKKLDRSGKLDKVVGTLTGSTKLKQYGLQKQADAAAIRQQTQLGS